MSLHVSPSHHSLLMEHQNLISPETEAATYIHE